MCGSPEALAAARSPAERPDMDGCRRYRTRSCHRAYRWDCAPRQDLDQARCVMSGAMEAGEWRHARRRSGDRGRHPGAGDIAGEVVRQAAGDGRDRMLVKTTAPRAQPRRAGSRPTRRLAGRHREPSPEHLAAARVSVARRRCGSRQHIQPGGGDSGAMGFGAAAPPRRPASLWVPRRHAAGQGPAATRTLRAASPPSQWRIRQPCYRLRHACRAARQ
jgi:hypothetical protein